ncbi:unnamed protein product [Periconia digitata]|uniref:Uncharacterized protein n=1 Tax=Periconia digitata TaxID=1303443 RepID=A0A9W4XTD3_9PLEO|nr:unnamed protein product [Periconia digitata]
MSAVTAVRTIASAGTDVLPSGGVPLLTQFSTPAECSTRWFHSSSSGENYLFNFSRFKIASDTEYFDYYFSACLPYSTLAAVISPGVCPSGREAGNIVYYSAEQLYVGECCPSGWWVTEPGRTGCSTIFTTPWTAITGYTESGTTYWDSPMVITTTGINTVRDGDGSIVMRLPYTTSSVTKKSTTVVSSGIASAEPFQIFWKAEDLRLFPTEYASSLASRIDVPFATSTPASPGARLGSGTPQTSTPVPGLSTAAKAGIGVGSVLGSAVAIGALVITLLWRRRSQRRRDELVAEGDGDHIMRLELPGEDAIKKPEVAYIIPEVHGKALNEVDATPRAIAEIDSRNIRAELV